MAVENDPKFRRRKAHLQAVGPKLKKCLAVVFALFALLVVNSVYLVSVTVAGVRYQNWFYLNMFMLHLILGLAITVPVVLFGIIHIRNTRHRKNRRAIKAGYAVFINALLLLATGFVLTRIDLWGFRFEINQPLARSTAYWLHVLCPLLAVWFFVLHRLAGKRIKWRVGLSWTAVAAVFAAGMLFWQTQDPRSWNTAGPETGEKYFFPSLSRTSTGNFIPAKVLRNDEYCAECHTEVHRSWSDSVHRFSSFNNPAYLFSVKETRRKLMQRDGTVQGSRFCAGCHDPVPFFSGAFDDPKFDDPSYDLDKDVNAQAGITCTVCHAISHINSPRGNADYTIDEPQHYPFTFNENPLLQWVNRQMIKAKPEFHKATFLKPLHKSSEFCGTCHKVHLPPELNAYKWLRGQNHYDSFWLSGVSGQGVTSFYYPPVAEPNCNGCHMPLTTVSDQPNFGARVRDDSNRVKTLDHRFPSANTALPHLMPERFTAPKETIAAHQKFLEGVMRVDLFGIKKGGEIQADLIAPLGPDLPVLQPGGTYLLETVIRTLKMGHLFTQGTADSNQIWLDIKVSSAGRIIGRSGGLKAENGAVDPWSHFVNSFVIDRHGNRINRRNAEDIFVALYNHQIPPGAGDVVHYLLRLPAALTEPVTVEISLCYRKFDTEYMGLIHEDPDYRNDLPITVLAKDRIVFPVGEGQQPTATDTKTGFPLWQRWNDYGIGLLRKGRLGELRQAREAFRRVESLGRADGPLNLARTYIKEGLIQTHAPEALARAAAMDPPANPWSLLWFGAQVAARNGDYAAAIVNLEDLIRGGFREAEGRGFDFSKDYRVHNALADAYYQSGLRLRGEERDKKMTRARDHYHQCLVYDPENLSAHWGLKQVYGDLGNEVKEAFHTARHSRYKPDDNSRDSAVGRARLQYPAANHAAEDIVIYDLNREDAYDSDFTPKGGRR